MLAFGWVGNFGRMGVAIENVINDARERAERYNEEDKCAIVAINSQETEEDNKKWNSVMRDDENREN